MKKLALLLSSLAIVLSILLLSLSSSSNAANLPSLPPTLKSSFMIGLGNQKDNIGNMNKMGVPWDARYTYLSGGVNTGWGWATWNSPSGYYAYYYMTGSDSNGYLPILTHYQLLQSLPHSGNTEGDMDYNNLNNTGTMYTYYSEFKLLMDMAKLFGKPVIIHVEPDFWAYMQMRNTNPNNISASVTTSNYAPVAGLPNTVSGFAQALVKLRNTYAPNALLAFHVSDWASTYGDLGSSKDANFNVSGAATQTANFYNQLNANFDLLFYDVLDRDAGYYQYVYGDSSRWWDTNNATYPNFNRFHQFVSLITAATNKRGMLWQVPMGNTIYCTENNTDGHYQDNRVQYYLNNSNQHILDAINSGLIGILFGAGAGGQSTYEDAKGDGVTNPYPCGPGTTLQSTQRDDDGGYLRLQAQAYYQRGQIPLQPTTTTLTSSVNPAVYGQTINLTATISPTSATGTVTFKDGNTAFFTSTIAAGVAVYSTSNFSVATHSITAIYNGTTAYQTSTSNTVSQVVNKAPVNLTLKSSSTPQVLNQPVTYTVSVSPLTATGTVTFTDGGTTLGTVTLSNGVASSSKTYTQAADVGNHTIGITYSGDTNYLSISTPVSITQVINRMPVTLTVTSSPNAANPGDDVAFNVAISPIAATGTVTFTDTSNSASLGDNLPLSGSGTATTSTNTLAIGVHPVQVIYSGNSFYAPATAIQNQLVGSCNLLPVQVFNITDDGSGSTCGSFSYVLTNAPGISVTFALTTSNTITFTGPLVPPVKNAQIIDGGNQGIVLNGGGIANNKIVLKGNNTLINLTIRNFAGQQLVVGKENNRNIKLKHVVISHT